MDNKFLIVDKKILPNYFEKVVEASALLKSAKAKDVSEAVKIVGISRSTYYKYKDYIFEPNTDNACRKAIISMMLVHQQGVLSKVLSQIANMKANVWTINQNPPVNSQANVVLSLDMTEATAPIDEILGKLNQIDGISNVKLIGIE